MMACRVGVGKQARQHLKEHETELRARRIMRITDGNWFRYGAVRNRDAMLSDAERFYVRCRTRDAHPFFYDERYARDGVRLYSGGIIGLFRNDGVDGSITRDAVMEYLNGDTAADVFVAMGMTTGSKKTFMPSTLSELPVPAAIVSHV